MEGGEKKWWIRESLHSLIDCILYSSCIAVFRIIILKKSPVKTYTKVSIMWLVIYYHVNSVSTFFIIKIALDFLEHSSGSKWYPFLGLCFGSHAMWAWKFTRTLLKRAALWMFSPVLLHCSSIPLLWTNYAIIWTQLHEINTWIVCIKEWKISMLRRRRSPFHKRISLRWKSFYPLNHQHVTEEENTRRSPSYPLVSPKF